MQGEGKCSIQTQDWLWPVRKFTVNWWVVLLCQKTGSFCPPPEHPLERSESDNQWRRKKRGKDESERGKRIHLMWVFSMDRPLYHDLHPPLTSLIERFRKTLWPLTFRTIGTGMFPSVRKPGQQQEHEGAHGKATVYCETGWEDLSFTHTHIKIRLSQTKRLQNG